MKTYTLTTIYPELTRAAIQVGGTKHVGVTVLAGFTDGTVMTDVSVNVGPFVDVDELLTPGRLAQLITEQKARVDIRKFVDTSIHAGFKLTKAKAVKVLGDALIAGGEHVRERFESIRVNAVDDLLNLKS